MITSFDRQWLTERLGEQAGWWSALDVVDATGSTNADLSAAARAGAPSGTVLIAEHQRSGRGRFTRSWEAPPGAAVAISVLLRPPASIPLERWTWLPLVAGLAVAEGLHQAAGVPARLKWPNDVLINDRKVCGILVERVGDAAVIGMGVNTRLRAEELPVPTATSLLLAGAETSNGEVAAAVLTALRGWYQRWEAGDDLSVAYQEVCATIGRQVRVELGPDESRRGEAVGIDRGGRLLVRTAIGLEAFAAGDVVHLR
ncbi:biotin--[acetyl-CoA-carboxylase] ligase [Propionicimonas paludicola]|uniref:biotin--[acetyl-CoA-carboxylase] ligase n=1 Tax=Propionicimonas paludicola TaxID=185243 RepID=UPI001FE5C629|nr:biotin--[acetyl-CoA-carboxylase] ligase [Propionicimonas paludicola]